MASPDVSRSVDDEARLVAKSGGGRRLGGKSRCGGLV